MTEPILAAIQQWILFVTVTLVVGCVAWRFVVAGGVLRLAPGTHDVALAAIESRVASVGVTTGFVLLGAWGLRMVVQVMGFHFPGDPLWPDVSFLLFETFWGTVWMAQGALVPFAIAAFWLVRRRAWPLAREHAQVAGSSRLAGPWYLAAALALGLAATLCLSGHAMGVEARRALIVTADGVHTLAAGTWIGSLALIVTAGRPRESTASALELYAAQIRSFSPMAVASVAVLLTMGVVLAWTHLSTVSDLWTMTYGRVLSAKIGVALLVFGAGLLNWRKGIRDLGTEAGTRVLQRRATWEVSLAGGVLLLTAVLVHSPKP